MGNDFVTERNSLGFEFLLGIFLV